MNESLLPPCRDLLGWWWKLSQPVASGHDGRARHLGKVRLQFVGFVEGLAARTSATKDHVQPAHACAALTPSKVLLLVLDPVASAQRLHHPGGCFW